MASSVNPRENKIVAGEGDDSSGLKAKKSPKSDSVSSHPENDRGSQL